MSMPRMGVITRSSSRCGRFVLFLVARTRWARSYLVEQSYTLAASGAPPVALTRG